ncbi:MAG: hypothetical protein J0H27_14235 [Xanthomonadales bacterium]|nr:hypothetical protein [Xanthomonadales bacterium]ODU93080.1 MAG: hypothetical protein ABT18_09965 [Rhodanobacter sp. SCN 66-43]OJY83751.1 MAG: hypothetical protein BGP23_14045 [Xanthomonadales bacterium 66-474]
MTSRAQIAEAAAAVAAACKLDAKQLKHYCRWADRAGYHSSVDQLATVLLAGSVASDAPGPAAAAAITAGIYRRSPARAEDAAARIYAEICRRCPTRGRWQDQYLPTDAPRRAPRALARQLAREESHRRFPGATRSAASKRRRFVLKACGPMHTKCAGGAA